MGSAWARDWPVPPVPSRSREPHVELSTGAAESVDGQRAGLRARSGRDTLLWNMSLLPTEEGCCIHATALIHPALGCRPQMSGWEVSSPEHSAPLDLEP